jgi:hypothetical protein
MPTVWTIREQLKRGNIRLVGGSSNLACPGKAGSAVAGAADQAEAAAVEHVSTASEILRTTRTDSLHEYVERAEARVGPIIAALTTGSAPSPSEMKSCGGVSMPTLIGLRDVGREILK